MTDVSVVMTARDAARFIGDAIESARSQTLPPAEIIVVDDGSSDDTASLAEDLGATVLRREPRSIGAARNDGIATSRGAVIAFLDADDLWLPTKLERQLAVLDERPDVGAVACLVDEFHDRTAAATTTVRAARLGAAAVLASNTAVRREVVDRLGPFDERSGIADWVAWWAGARRADVVEHIVPEVLVRRRIHDRNTSAQVADDGTGFLALARAHRQAKRAGS